MNTDWISIAGGVAGVVGAIAGIWAAWVSHAQWKQVNRKILMVADASLAEELVPAWYARRMMQDHWLFGLLTADGRVIVITQILAVSDDGQWLDVHLAESDQGRNAASSLGKPVYAVATDRTRASIQVSNILAAVELQTS